MMVLLSTPSPCSFLIIVVRSSSQGRSLITVVLSRSWSRYPGDCPTVTPAPTGPTRTPTSSANAGVAISATATIRYFMLSSWVKCQANASRAARFRGNLKRDGHLQHLPASEAYFQGWSNGQFDSGCSKAKAQAVALWHERRAQTVQVTDPERGGCNCRRGALARPKRSPELPSDRASATHDQSAVPSAARQSSNKDVRPPALPSETERHRTWRSRLRGTARHSRRSD